MPKAPSLAGRALAAVLLLVGFYLLAIGVIIGLVAIPWAEAYYAHRIDLRIVIACAGAAFLVFVSIIPRRDKFIPPGPLLDEKEQPRLFEVIRELASKTGQAMPVEVYLDADLNAYVSQRGGMMGFGSRRIMGLGLPLLQLLSVSQMKAVLAHEFGHFHGGDTALGPWIYKTRAALGRTIQNLAASRSILTRVFDWYGTAFIRITHAISRRQEFAADALAANTVGALPLIEGLRLLHSGSSLFHSFWNNDVAPVMDYGYAPPYATGFAQLANQPVIIMKMQLWAEEEMRYGTTNPADTHPPLNERVKALAGLPSTPHDFTEGRAISWIDNAGQLEGELMQMVARRIGKPLKPISWAETGEKVWVENWRISVREHYKRLDGITPARVATLAKDAADLAIALQFASSKINVMDEHRHRALGIIGGAIGLALHARGWVPVAEAGEPLQMVKEGKQIAPFGALYELGSGKLTPESWETVCRDAGIWEVNLGHVN